MEQLTREDMYYRIFNSFDVENMISTFHNQDTMVVKRLAELADTMDTNYGASRSQYELGSCIIFFPTKRGYLELFDKILDYYHLDPTMAEYDDVIGDQDIDGIEWHEKLWMLGTEDSVVFVHPKEAQNRV